MISTARISPYSVLVDAEDLREILGEPGPAEILPEGEGLRILGRGWEARLEAGRPRVYDTDRHGLRILGHILEEEASQPAPQMVSRIGEALRLARLVEPEGPSAMSQAVRADLDRRCSQGVERCWGLLREWIGRGFGFTPEGDDAVMGFLSTASSTGVRIVSRREVEDAVSRTHEVSGRMILETLDLNLYSDQEEILKGLMSFALGLGGSGSPAEIFSKALRIGASSGYFYTYGAVLAMLSLTGP